MSYPKNADTPKAVTVGSVILIADGTVQTDGCSVRVSLDGGAWGAGGGTLAYDATSGVVTYAPIKAETNGDVLKIAVYKASCIGCSTTALMDLATGDAYALGVAGVHLSVGTGAGQISVSSGVVAASGNWNVGKTGYALTTQNWNTVVPDAAGVVASALTVIKGATWDAGTDTLEAIRNKLPTNLEDLSVTDTTGLVATADTQKVDVNTLKTQAVTCGAAVTILASVGTAATSTAQTGDLYAIGKAGGGGDLAAILLDTGELETDWKNGGRLDLILDSLVSGAATNITITTAEFTVE